MQPDCATNPPDKAFRLERNIWIVWLQGFSNPPPLVTKCVETWKYHNPGWNVHCLHLGNIKDHVDQDFLFRIQSLDLPPQKFANLLRLHLITRHGGVWADATCYCAVPLDDWIDDQCAAGFFAFRFDADGWLVANSGKRIKRIMDSTGDRTIANWFLAGSPRNAITQKFLSAHLGLFEQHRFKVGKVRRLSFSIVRRMLRRNAYLATLWSNRSVLHLTRAYPYFIFHYHFAATMLKDPLLACRWRLVPSILATESLRYSKTLHLDNDPEFDAALRGHRASVYKLHWDKNAGADLPKSRYAALLAYVDSDFRSETSLVDQPHDARED